jgi:chitin synthase
LNHASHEYGYLSDSLHNMVFSKANADATELFYGIFPNAADQEAALDCLNELFYHARVDDRYSAQCARISTAQYALAGILGFFIFVQVSCSLAYIARRPPMVRDEDKRAAVMIMVPCYNESDRELRKTIDSVLANDYPNENKVLVVVADGVITGRGEKKSCPETLAAILGFQFRANDPAQVYQSTGTKTTNYATVYPGTYTSAKYPGKELKYLVVVKQGSEEERGTGRAGNRGKRDSQLLLFGILNRLQYNRRPTDLDVEYLLAIDADTRVSQDALKFFVHKMDKDKSVLACCGETRVDNKSQSFTTMIQVSSTEGSIG